MDERVHGTETARPPVSLAFTAPAPSGNARVVRRSGGSGGRLLFHLALTVLACHVRVCCNDVTDGCALGRASACDLATHVCVGTEGGGSACLCDRANGYVSSAGDPEESGGCRDELSTVDPTTTEREAIVLVEFGVRITRQTAVYFVRSLTSYMSMECNRKPMLCGALTSTELKQYDSVSLRLTSFDIEAGVVGFFAKKGHIRRETLLPASSLVGITAEFLHDSRVWSGPKGHAHTSPWRLRAVPSATFLPSSTPNATDDLTHDEVFAIVVGVSATVCVVGILSTVIIVLVVRSFYYKKCRPSVVESDEVAAIGSNSEDVELQETNP